MSISRIRNIINTDMNDLSKQLSNVDKELSNKYHEIERNKYSASNGYKELIILQNILLRRREIKDQWSVYQKLRRVLNG